MPVKRYNGSTWDVVAGDGTTGPSGTAPLTTKGDLLGFDTAANRVAVGTNGQTLVADSTATAGIRWQDTFVAGKNAIINSDFGIWQRGTSFTTGSAYTADRFQMEFDGSGATNTVSQQTFTPGTAPVSGYEGKYFLRYNRSAAGTSNTYNQLVQKIEDVRKFAGQTATLSFWAKADSARSVTVGGYQVYGTGGSPSGATSNGFSGTASVTTSWQRFSFTASVPSISGKTLGTNNDSYLSIILAMPTAATFTVDIWGVQLEAGSVATPFITATGTVQGELAACQRYYWRNTADGAYTVMGTGAAESATAVIISVPVPTQMRVLPSVVEASNLAVFLGVTPTTPSSIVSNPGESGRNFPSVTCTITGGVTGSFYRLMANNNSSAYLGLSAEL
jgi:hypothetical protein